MGSAPRGPRWRARSPAGWTSSRRVRAESRWQSPGYLRVRAAILWIGLHCGVVSGGLSDPAGALEHLGRDLRGWPAVVRDREVLRRQGVQRLLERNSAGETPVLPVARRLPL